MEIEVIRFLPSAEPSPLVNDSHHSISSSQSQSPTKQSTTTTNSNHLTTETSEWSIESGTNNKKHLEEQWSVDDVLTCQRQSNLLHPDAVDYNKMTMMIRENHKYDGKNLHDVALYHPILAPSSSVHQSSTTNNLTMVCSDTTSSFAPPPPPSHIMNRSRSTCAAGAGSGRGAANHHFLFCNNCFTSWICNQARTIGRYQHQHSGGAVAYRPTAAKNELNDDDDDDDNDDNEEQNIVAISDQSISTITPPAASVAIVADTSTTSTNRQNPTSFNSHHLRTLSSSSGQRRTSQTFVRFFQHFLIKMAIGAFLFILVASIFQSFFILTFKCEDTTKISNVTTPINNKNLLDKSSSCDQSSSLSMLLNQTQDLSFSSSSSSNNKYLDTKGQPFPWTNVRLPTYIKPIHYDLYMNPDVKMLINTANVSIHLKITNKTNGTRFLIVHTKKLDILNVSMFHIDNSNNNNSHNRIINVVKFRECVKLEQLYIEVDEDLLPSSQYKLIIEFYREIEDQLEGFYVSSYYNEKKKRKQKLLTTHFEPTLARTAFPCFDEPAMKASFSLSMVHDPEYRVYFNTEKISEREIWINGTMKYLSQFEQTVPMSTYVVAFIVCDFSMVDIESKGVRIGALVPVGQEQNSKYALNATKHILSYFENFFKIPYPLKKLDVVAVPDFGAGAMENWGLVTFRLTTLLYNEKESSSETKEQVAIVVAHELAHQWFGNLVTMNWWNDLWLNEGFASYVENLGVDHIHPEWRMLDQFVISTSQHALAMDSLLNSHPINTTVVNPADIEGIFDLISYKKGSCLIRMIVGFLGIENLQRGLEKYLNRYKFETAQTSQLWECFSEASISLPVNVSAIMDTWIFQQGYPVISVRWTDDSKHILVTQQPFISSLGPEEFEKKYQQKNQSVSFSLRQTWIVPLTLTTMDNLDQSQLYWLNSSSMIIPLDRSTNKWFKLNHKQSGFYRVNYQQTIWSELIKMLSNSKPDRHKLSPSDRAGLIDDALSLMRIGYLNVNIAMDLTKYLEFGEYDYVPWETLLSHWGIIDAIMPQNLMFHRYILRLIHSIVHKLGWDERPTDGLFEKKLRAIVLRAAVYYGHQPCIDKARQYFQRWMVNSVPVPVNIREIVYSAGVEHGTDIEWFHCLDQYMKTTVASEKRLLLGVLGSTRNRYLLSVYLESSLNRSLIRTQDTYFVIQNVARNPIGREMAWRFVRSNWKIIFEMLGLGSFALDTIISETTWHFSTEFDYKEVENYFSAVQVGSGKQAVKQSLEKIRGNIYWKQYIEHKVINWLIKVNNNNSKSKEK